jgi:hypothetical protein
VSFSVLQLAIAQNVSVADKLEVATDAFNEAFNAVLEAEKAGANVTSLVTELSNLASLLDIAENAYRIGEQNTVIAAVESVVPLANSLVVSANNAKGIAQDASQAAFWSSITYSVIGIAVFAVVLFIVWCFIKNSYIKGIKNAEPRVISNEA